MAAETTSKGLRVLAADEDEATLRAVDTLLAKLGHTVTAHAVTVQEAASTTTTTTRSTSSRRSASTRAGP